MSDILAPVKQIPLSKEERIAKNILRTSSSLFNQLLTQWELSVKSLWQGDTEAILAELGTNSVEVFRVSAETVKFLEALKPGCTVNGRALMRAFTEHEDGTITLD